MEDAEDGDERLGQATPRSASAAARSRRKGDQTITFPHACLTLSELSEPSSLDVNAESIEQSDAPSSAPYGSDVGSAGADLS